MEEDSGILSDVTEAAVDAANETVGQISSKFVDYVKTFATWHNLFKIIGAIIVILIMWLVFKLIKHAVKKISTDKIPTHVSKSILKLISYVFYVLVVMYVLSLFGVKLSAIWGAAGIAGVAIGFAAQTSVSNFISGLFVIGEKTMKIGDSIQVGGVSGIVDSIGLLSIKIHTPDNQLIRIPNSSIINTNFQNNSFFENRRFLFEVPVDYSTDLDFALEVIKTVPEQCPSVLKNPAPNAWYSGFGDSGVNLTLAVWFEPKNLAQMQTEVYKAIIKTFDEKGINIPFNRFDVAMVKE